MHITLETDYAIRIVDLLVKAKKNPDPAKHRIDAGTISESTFVPVRFSLKILRKLVAGGIVKSYKGASGGYELVKQPSELSLYDIVELVEGTYRFSRCLDKGYSCTCNTMRDELPCTYQRVFGEVTEKVCALLREQTFDKLIK